MLPVPNFYDPRKVGTLYAPNVLAAMNAGASMYDPDRVVEKTALLLVDPQVDFIHANGSLSVPGAVEDTRRTIEWIFANIEKIGSIFVSLDSHVPVQIFSESWWVDKNGKHPDAFTVISHDDVKNKRWIPLYEAKWSLSYTERLETDAKKQLMIWPYHTLIGTPGHAIDPALYEAIVYHGAFHGTQPTFIVKGTIPTTENYSIFEPEVKDANDPTGGVNYTYLQELESQDKIYVAGQAKSHCVLESVASLERYFPNDIAVMGKIHLLMKQMSSVVHPLVDFEKIANAQFAKFAQAGMHLVNE